MNTHIKNQLRESQEKHRRDHAFLRDVSNDVKEQLNALMVEEMTLVSLIQQHKDSLNAKAQQNKGPVDPVPSTSPSKPKEPAPGPCEPKEPAPGPSKPKEPAPRPSKPKEPAPGPSKVLSFPESYYTSGLEDLNLKLASFCKVNNVHYAPDEEYESDESKGSDQEWEDLNEGLESPLSDSENEVQ